MQYITVKRDTNPAYQMSLEEMLLQTFKIPVRSWKESDTITFTRECISEKHMINANVPHLISQLTKFVIKYDNLYQADRESLYSSFKIPKKTGGFRQICAPNEELTTALRELKEILETDFRAMYHTSAFAYISKRSTIDCVKRHQSNKSRWFAKLDLHDFFGSTTLDFFMNQIRMIYPFSVVCQYRQGEAAIRKALDLCFLNGGLPQGTPISPMLTNLMMIPIDFDLFNSLRCLECGDGKARRFVYTRYADDFIISSVYNFNIEDIVRTVKSSLEKFSAPFSLNDKKTRYGSSAGSNWNLGVMLNANNDITVGFKNKRNFQCALVNLVRDVSNGVRWSLGDLQHLQGLYSYYHMVEPTSIDSMIEHLNNKLRVSALDVLNAEIKSYSPA